MSKVENVSASPDDLVVVGSSAGGVEALSVLVGTLPANFPAPIVLAQHLDPTRPSSLDTILQRRSVLPVEVITSSSKLEVGKIYVVPANRSVAIRDHRVEVQEDRARRPRPSVDALLSTAAEAYGERLIAVILTGSGSDGAAGAVDVKNAGGIVVVQDPKTARYPSMPLALPPTVVDFEADIERIGPLLYDLLTGVALPHLEEKTDDILRSILEQVNRQASIDFRSYKTSTILRRISRRMAVTHNRSLGDYAQYLAQHPEEIGELVKAFLINVTQFFRDPDAFAYLKNEILPILVAQARERDRVLRFWTAGCATGEEPYSLAMLLTDLLGAELAQWSVKIFATDLDDAAIAFARRGVYSESLLKSVPAEYRERFFERIDHGYRISKTLRQMVIFGQQDLSKSAPFPRINLVMCRNVLIYFTPELQDYVLSRFAFSLYPNGYLFLGKAETVRPLQSYYELVNKHWKVYRCTGNALPAVARPGQSDMRSLEGYSPGRLVRVTGKQQLDQESASSLELERLRRFDELLLRFLPVGVVVLNRTYTILATNAAARRLLGLRDMGTEQDFLHSVRGIPYSAVRSTIDAVFRERNPVTLAEVELTNPLGGNGRFVCLSMAVMQMEAGSPDLAVVSVTDVTEQVQVRRQLEAVQTEQAQLVNELATANKRLNDVNKELMDANEELQIANEELVLTHEELQATIEEFETTNEELQATNEELETNNEELQATNEELETTNEELRARTGELQELSNMLESERVRLTEMVELAPFYIMVLRGPTLLVETFNPRYAPLLEGRAVQDRPLEEVFELFWEAGMPLVLLAREVYKQDAVRTTPRTLTHVPNAQGELVESYFVYTMVPSHDASGRVSGVIIYAMDETMQRAQEIEEERQRLKLVFDNASMAALALFDAQSTELIMGSQRYLDIVAYLCKIDQGSLVGCKWQELAFVAPDETIQAWNTVLESRQPLHLAEIHLKLPPDEQETVWYCKLIPILDQEKENTIRFVLFSAVEITEQVQARQEMERLNRLKDDFLSLASHELRTPLTSMQGNAQLLQRRVKRWEKSAGSSKGTSELNFEEANLILDRVIYQINRMNKLIDEMLDITRIRGELFQLKIRKNVDIVELARRVIEQYTNIAGHPLTLETSQEAIAGNWDETRIEQVLNNLVSNAIKYSPPGKPVVIGIERHSGGEGGRSDEVVVWVRDQGPGISEEKQAHVFDRFYRVQDDKQSSIEGLGLGLYIAREIVALHGGRMWVESKEGAGSTFYFALPLKGA